MTKEYFWQMTFKEFKDYQFKNNPDSNPFVVEDGWLYQIKMALDCGNDVPEEVLNSHREYCFVKQVEWEIHSKNSIEDIYLKSEGRLSHEDLYAMYQNGDLQIRVIYSEESWSDGCDSNTDFFYYCENLNAVLFHDDANSEICYVDELSDVPEEVINFIASRGL